MAFPSPVFSYGPNPALPGHEYGGIHGGRIILPSWHLIVAKVPCAPVFLILPVTEALQGPLTVVPDGQLGLKEIGGEGRAFREAKAQGSQSLCRD